MHRRLALLHVCKTPPSNSGVVRYASSFRSARGHYLDIAGVSCGPDASDSATLRRCVSAVIRAARASKRHDVVLVELSGRALAELFVAALLPQRVKVWIVCHDPPSLAGWSFGFSVLDRRGLRRLAGLLSRTVGSRVERRVLHRADRIFTLSAPGRAALTSAHALTPGRVEVLPFVAPVIERSPRAERATVFVAFPVREGVLARVLTVADAERDHVAEVIIGSGVGGEIVDSLARNHPGIAVRSVGFVPDDELDELYRSSDIVVRVDDRNVASAGNWAAASGPVFDCLRYGCVLVTNMAKGAADTLIHGENSIVVSDDASEFDHVLADLLRSPRRRYSIAEAAQRTAAERYSAERVIEVLMAAEPREAH